jgi:KUP system potassium uptake protein
VIASQAVITGAFSVTRQAVQLGLLPRFEIRHTSATHGGQVFLPRVNGLLLVGVFLLVLLFQTSGALASAYGIAVTGSMIVDTVLVLLVLNKARGWPLALAAAAAAPFFAIEAAFLAANLLKLLDGGYVPVLLAAFLATAMVTWAQGTAILAESSRHESVPLAGLIADLGRSRSLSRVPGTAVFLTSSPDTAPGALLHNLKHNHVLHERNVVLTMQADQAPYVEDAQAGRGDARSATASPSCAPPSATWRRRACRRSSRCAGARAAAGADGDSFFLSRRSIRASASYGMPLWQDRLFIASPATR